MFTSRHNCGGKKSHLLQTANACEQYVFVQVALFKTFEVCLQSVQNNLSSVKPADQNVQL